MITSDVRAGFKIWAAEAQGMEPRSYASREEVPIAGLVGVYCSLINDSNLLTSYGWRRAILSYSSMAQALANVTGNLGFVQADDEFPLDVDPYSGRSFLSLQEQAANAAIFDGLPNTEVILTAREEYLARHLGFAAHNFAVAFRPLRLTEIGLGSFALNFPVSYEYVSATA